MDLAALPSEAPQPPADSVDLFTLVGQFTALRQEVNLQTRAVRSQQEQNAESLRHTAETFQSLRQAQQLINAQEAEARLQQIDAAVQPLLKALVDVADSQLLTIRELTRAVQTVKDLLPERRPAADSLPQPPATGLFARLFGIGRLTVYQQQLAQHIESQQQGIATVGPWETTAQIERILESALAGLGLGLQRVERILRQFELEPIPTVGRPFDPERMEALEIAPDSNRPPGEVIDELRRGYWRKGKVFRFAQVRVSK